MLWAVEYRDGTVLQQWDKNHPQFVGSEDHPFGGEVPYRAIQWHKVARVIFGNADREDSFDFGEVPEGLKPSLRSRHYTALGCAATCWFLLVLSKQEVEVTDESTEQVFYWGPNGETHICPKLNCPVVNSYAAKALRGSVVSLPESCYTKE